MPVWHCGDPAGWIRYKGSVPWHQADRTGEIEDLVEIASDDYSYQYLQPCYQSGCLKLTGRLAHNNKRTNFFSKQKKVIRIPLCKSVQYLKNETQNGQH